MTMHRRSIPLLLALALAAIALPGCLSGGAVQPQNAQAVKEFTLEAKETPVELYPGKNVTAWTFNGQLPGPVLRVTEGDLVRIRFYNNHTLPHSLHFHGDHPFEMDGDDHTGVPPGGNFTYEFRATPAGAFVYHCHVDTPLHVAMGLSGQFIVDPVGGWPGPKADREVYLMWSDWNPNHNASAETYLVNGKAFPGTEPFQADVGEHVRIFMSNMVEDPVAAHLHGTVLQEVWPGKQPADIVPLAHGESRVLDYQPKFPGAWMLHDHYEHHLKNDGVYPGGSLTSMEVGKDWWGRFYPTMGLPPPGRSAPAQPAPGGHGGHGDQGGDDAPAAGAEVLMEGFRFAPENLTVKQGTTVVWKNRDNVPHTVTSDDAAGPLQSGNLKAGATYAYTFQEPGTYAYHCAPHAGKGGDGKYAGMVGTIIVTG